MLRECKRYYQDLQKKCAEVIDKSFEKDTEGLHAKSHHFLKDLEVWIEVLSNRPEIILLKIASTEYQYSLLSLVQGQYRQSFMSLRFFLEHTLGMIYFSANELELRVWLRGQADISWGNLINSESGVFAKKFILAFFEDLSEYSSQYRTIAERVYRECSEFVHGNITTQNLSPYSIEYDSDAFYKWHEKIKNIRLIITFSLCARYLNFIPEQDQSSLEPILLDEIGHISEVRTFFDKGLGK